MPGQRRNAKADVRDADLDTVMWSIEEWFALAKPGARKVCWSRPAALKLIRGESTIMNLITGFVAEGKARMVVSLRGDNIQYVVERIA